MKGRNNGMKRNKLTSILLIVLISCVLIRLLPTESLLKTIEQWITVDTLPVEEPTKTAEPKPESTLQPTLEPTPELTPEPTSEPTPEPAFEPTPEPTSETTPEPIPEVPNLEIHQINVGCASAYLIRCGEVSIFIDGGESNNRNKVLNYIASKGVGNINTYIATHYHDDHVDNMVAICNEFSVDQIMAVTDSLPAKYTPDCDFTYIQMVNGRSYDFGNFQILCVGPYKFSNGTSNYDSLNFILKYKSQSFFFTGDYCFSVQLIDDYENELRDITLLQFPHHGLKCGDFYITKEALQVISPEIILVAANSSGNTERFAKEAGVNAKFYNNKSGNIVIISDGIDTTVITEK